jgi:glycosyltransferase involved in cell wall biosynthesis
MKIAMLIWQFWPARTGGAERQCYRLSTQLIRHGVQVCVFTSWPGLKVPRREWREGVEIVRCGFFRPALNAAERCREGVLRRMRAPAVRSSEGDTSGALWKARPAKQFRLMAPFRWSDRAAFILEVKRALARWRPDLLHIHESHWIAGVGAWAAQKLDIPCVCKESTYPPFPRFEQDTPFPEFWARKRKECNAYVVLAREAATALAEQGVASERIVVIPNGVDLPDMERRKPENDLVLCVANLSQGAGQKGFDMLLTAWSRVTTALPQARLVMAGGGDPHPWELQANMLGCRASISFAGYVPDVSDLYSRAAVFVLPSRIEGMSNALLEAQSWGIPVVATDIPGNRAVIRSAHNGVLVPVDDSDAMANALVRLLRDPVKRTTMGEAARRTIESAFSIQVVSHRWMELYQRLLEEHRVSRRG